MTIKPKLPMTGILPVLKPLSVGAHTVEIFLTLSTDHWDGFGLEPSENLVPAGVTHWASTTFDVRPRSR